jgi:hypothetical protein
MLLCHMRYLKLVRRLTRTDDLWELDNADRHCASLAQKLNCSPQSIARSGSTGAIQRKYSANRRMRSLSIYDQIWIFHIFG